MTVKELMEKLQQMPQDALVITTDRTGDVMNLDEVVLRDIERWVIEPVHHHDRTSVQVVYIV